MSLRVLNVAFPFAPVGTDSVGGAEQVLSAIDRALVKGGHASLVLAAEGSRCAGTLLPVPRWRNPGEPRSRARAWTEHRRRIEEAVASQRIDVVHYHGIDFKSYLVTAVPALATLHLPPRWYPPSVFSTDDARYFLCWVSASQRDRAAHISSVRTVIPNGVDLETFRPSPVRERFAVSLGRICPEKGYHFALAAARRAAIPFVLAGEIFPFPEHQRYFERRIRPQLDAERQFRGPVGLEQKRNLLSRARCVLVPSLAEETSSLVAMEALASGTPVIAFRSGALTEIVEEGRTGFLVGDEREMAEAIGRVGDIDRRTCREAAEERFAEKTMTERYVRLYEELAAAGKSPSISPGSEPVSTT